MASQEQQETLTLGKRASIEAEDRDEEGEIQELEREVNEMAQRILHFRKTIPDRLAEALSSRLLAQRPLLPSQIEASSSTSYQIAQTGIGSEKGIEGRAQSELSETASLAEADQGMLEKLRIFKAKTSSNVAAVPVILKRMNECIARIDKVDQYNVNIHSVFKKRRK